jgi:hypothetical protein
MDVSGRSVDMGMAEQGLHHRKIDAHLGQRGPERVPQGVRVTANYPDQTAVITEDRAQPGRSQRLTTVLPLGHEKQLCTARFEPLGQQINLDDGSHVRVERHPPLPLSFTEHLQPPAADVDVGDVQGQHLGRTQPATRNPQPATRNRASSPRSPVPPSVKTGQQLGRVRLGQRLGQPTWFAQSKRGTVLWPPDRMRQHSAPLTGCDSARFPALRDWGLHLRVPHRGEGEEPGDRGQPTVDRRRNVLIQSAPRQPDHVRSRPARDLGIAAGTKETKQHLRAYLGQWMPGDQKPPAERQQVIPVGTHRLG